MLQYAITHAGHQYATAAERREALRRRVHHWCSEGVDFLQLREKALGAGELLLLAEALQTEIAGFGCGMRLLINGRADVAIAAGAHGVHLTAAYGELTPAQVCEIFARSGRNRPFVSVSCHSVEEVERARTAGADLALFGPVYEKVAEGTPVVKGTGLDRLAEAVRTARPMPVLALGGVTSGHAAACIHAGAAGIAGIRVFE